MKPRKSAPIVRKNGAVHEHGDCVVLVDRDFMPIAVTRGAEAILQDINNGPSGAEGWVHLPPILLNLLSAQSELDSAVMILNARGHEYICHTFVIRSQSNVIAQPLIALYFKQELSVENAVLNVGSEYRLTDREQEVLMGVGWGLAARNSLFG